MFFISTEVVLIISEAEKISAKKKFDGEVMIFKYSWIHYYVSNSKKTQLKPHWLLSCNYSYLTSKGS